VRKEMNDTFNVAEPASLRAENIVQVVCSVIWLVYLFNRPNHLGVAWINFMQQHKLRTEEQIQAAFHKK
jgi:hypothetical protein